MCPLWPFHLLILHLIITLPLWLLCFHTPRAAATRILNGSFSPLEVEKLPEESETFVLFDGSSSASFYPDKLEVLSADKQIAEVTSNATFFNLTRDALATNISFGLTGRFLGHTTVRVRASNNVTQVESAPLKVSVVRPKKILDAIFIGSISVLLAINYVNMGCTLDMNVVKETLRRPKAPIIGIISQYIFMPLISFGLSYAIFDTPNMRLGLFTVGCSPGGGASNMWTYLLGGNLNLSITMTFLSNVLAFATMPLWLFTLGRILFLSSNITIPYTNIITTLIVLIFPLGIGLLIQRYLPKVAKVGRRILGPFAGFMIIFIIIFGIVANLYMFYLFDWRVILGGVGVPWLGYAFGAILSRIAGFSFEDIVAIAVETGVQNSGIAIVLLRFSIPQPDGDLTSVIPVAASIMMPLPLLCLLVIFRIRRRMKSGQDVYEVCDGELKSGAVVRAENSKTGLVDIDSRNGQHY